MFSATSSYAAAAAVKALPARSMTQLEVEASSLVGVAFRAAEMLDPTHVLPRKMDAESVLKKCLTRSGPLDFVLQQYCSVMKIDKFLKLDELLNSNDLEQALVAHFQGRNPTFEEFQSGKKQLLETLCDRYEKFIQILFNIKWMMPDSDDLEMAADLEAAMAEEE
jgi:hypothetical protein